MTAEDRPAHEAFVTPAVTGHGIALPSSVTSARLGLGRAGSGMPTRAVLAFALDHARARDAVHTPLDFEELERDLAALSMEMLRVESAAPDRETYLRRPDFGRRLSPRSRALLSAHPRPSSDVALVVGDGLSSKAVQTGAAPLLAPLVWRLRAMGLTLAPLVLARQARVALADEIGQMLDARLTLICIGERPGLSAADSLGAYLTLTPGLSRTDADRNCVSNIRVGGLDADRAAFKLAWLVDRALALGASGVRLKDESDGGSPPIAAGTSSGDAGHSLEPPPGNGSGPST